MQLISFDSLNCIMIAKKEELDFLHLTYEDISDENNLSKRARVFLDTIANICSKHIESEEFYCMITKNDNEDVAFVFMGDTNIENVQDKISKMLKDDGNEPLKHFFDFKTPKKDPECITISLKRYTQVHFNNMSEAINFCKKITGYKFSVNMLIRDKNGYALIVDYNQTIERMADEFIHMCCNIEELPTESLINGNAIQTLAGI